MRLIEYLPEFLQGIREYKEIFRVEDIEIDKLKEELEKILTEAVVTTAKDYGLERYEGIYGITNDEEDIEARRFKILSKINNRLPYSLNWLRDKLNTTVGKDNYTIDVDYDKYTLEINIAALFKNIAVILNDDLREQIPANMILNVQLFQTEECKTYFAGFVHVGRYQEIEVIR